jgi:hypothetical protein
MADHPGAEAIIRSVANALFNPNPQPPQQPASSDAKSTHTQPPAAALNGALPLASPSKSSSRPSSGASTPPGGSGQSDSDPESAGSDGEPDRTPRAPIPSARARSSSLKMMENAVLLSLPQAPTKENGSKVVAGPLVGSMPASVRGGAKVLERQSSSVSKVIAKVGRTLKTQTSQVCCAFAKRDVSLIPAEPVNHHLL